MRFTRRVIEIAWNRQTHFADLICIMCSKRTHDLECFKTFAEIFWLPVLICYPGDKFSESPGLVPKCGNKKLALSRQLEVYKKYQKYTLLLPEKSDHLSHVSKYSWTLSHRTATHKKTINGPIFAIFSVAVGRTYVVEMSISSLPSIKTLSTLRHSSQQQTPEK